MHFKVALFLFSVFGQAASKALDNQDDIGLTSNQANDFMAALRRSKRGLYHECYEESPCTFEEVEEVLGRTERAYEYYYTFTCTKYRRNCKVRCNYRKDCSFGEWGSWAGKGNSECYTQKRYKPYKHPIQTKLRRWGCSGLNTRCPSTPAESRIYCVCKKAQCSPGQWSSWSGGIRQGECGTQRRQQTSTVSWTTVSQIGSCNNITKKCNPPIVDIRKICSCKKAVCSLGSWSKWSGQVSQGKCGSQTRTQAYHKTFVYEEHSHCSGISQDCPSALTEKRDFCSCSYVTCKLGEWSDWKPKSLQRGSCGQKQTRKKTYEMSLAYQNHVGKCPTLPQKCPPDEVDTRERCMCSYRDSCALKKWSNWSEDVTEEGCKIQTRTRAYVSALKHVQRDSCKGLNTECIEQPKEARTYCKCKFVKCELGDWSDWSNLNVTTGSCGIQTRTQAYGAKEAFVNQVDDCKGLPTACPADKQEKRLMCKCNTVVCKIGDWGPWTGNIPKGACLKQERKKSMNQTNKIRYQQKTCDGLQTSCSQPQTESRTMCSCSYREDCTLKEWGAWSGDVPDVGCVVQTRSRAYNKSIIYVERESCNDLKDYVCPVIQDETRTKCNCNEVICNWTSWHRPDTDPKEKCYDLVRVKTVSAGIKKIEKFGSCDGIVTSCSKNDVEKRRVCKSGGGVHVITTSATPKTEKTTLPPTAAPSPQLSYLGCFADSGIVPRPLPTLYKSYRGKIDWNNLNKTIYGCAESAMEKRYQYFSVQFYGECWGGSNARKNYKRDGVSDKCWNGVGKEKTNAVYKIENMSVCSNELPFRTNASRWMKKEGAWCAGNSDKYQWIEVIFDGSMKISGVSTQGGNKDGWIITYELQYSEDGKSWVSYKGTDGENKVFAGNTNQVTLEIQWLESAINTRFLRFKPLSWSSTQVNCMKIKVYGCD